MKKGNDHTIMLVDDEESIRATLSDVLSDEGFRVITAADGDSALAQIEANAPDLIILDVMMPVLDGFQTLRLLKEKPETASIPIIMLTVRGSDADVRHGWADGVDLYLTKPFETSDLIASTKRILEDREPDQEAEDAL